jgi:hypothetical protein
VDLNHRPLGYESAYQRIVNELGNAGGTVSHRKKLQGILIGPLMDLRIRRLNAACAEIRSRFDRVNRTGREER